VDSSHHYFGVANRTDLLVFNEPRSLQKSKPNRRDGFNDDESNDDESNDDGFNDDESKITHLIFCFCYPGNKILFF